MGGHLGKICNFNHGVYHDDPRSSPSSPYHSLPPVMATSEVGVVVLRGLKATEQVINEAEQAF